MADAEGRQALHCIRCAACLNVCPVYRETGGHAYGSVYSGPIGAILVPQMSAMGEAQSLPYASSLCGACYEVCPTKIRIPDVLVHLRAKVVEQEDGLSAEALVMRAAEFALSRETRLVAAQKLARIGQKPFEHAGVLSGLPGPLSGWSQFRDLRPLPRETFRQWWKKRGTRFHESARA